MATNYYQDPLGAPDYSAEGMPSLLSLSNLESLGRGSVAGLLDLPYFFEGMLMGDQDPRMPQRRRVVPSSEQVLATTPRMTQPTPQAGLLETAGAFMSPAPVAAVKPVAKAVGKAIRATEGLPVGMGIKDVGKGITSNIPQFTGFKNTTPYGKAKEVAKYLDSLSIPYTLNKSKTTNSAYLEIQTGKGDFDYPMQFRFSDHSTDLPHQNRQIFTNPKPDPNFDLDVFKDGGHDAEFAVNKINELATKVKPQPVSQQVTYPQQAALDLAQQRAALPVEQGGLGLPANNTAMDRAKAMGFESGYVHGSPNPDITNLKPSITGAQGEGIYATNYLPEANMYSGTKEGATNYPLYVKTQKALDVGEANPYDVLGFDLQGQLSQRQKDAIISKQKETEDWLIRNGVPFMPSREHYVSTLPENFRSRFAAFDPFRKDVATAAAMGVAAPDLLAAEPTPEELQRRQPASLLFP